MIIDTLLKHGVASAIHDYMYDQGYFVVETPLPSFINLSFVIAPTTTPAIHQFTQRRRNQFVQHIFKTFKEGVIDHITIPKHVTIALEKERDGLIKVTYVNSLNSTTSTHVLLVAHIISMRALTHVYFSPPSYIPYVLKPSRISGLIIKQLKTKPQLSPHYKYVLDAHTNK
jgi:hypothetical protein